MPALKTKTARLFFAAGVIGLILGVAGAVWWRLPPLPVNSDPVYGTALDFTLLDLEGRERRLNEWAGSVVVINFWATWCPPCREEIPGFIGVQRERAREGLQIVGVAVEDAAAVRPFAAQLGINYPLLPNTERALALMSGFGNQRGSLPFSVILDRQGRIRHQQVGMLHVEELERQLSPLLRESAPAK